MNNIEYSQMLFENQELKEMLYQFLDMFEETEEGYLLVCDPEDVADIIDTAYIRLEYLETEDLD